MLTRLIMSLHELSSGQTGQIVSIEGDTQSLRTLTALGVARSAYVKVVDNRARHVTFRVGHRKVVIDRQVASGIDVLIC